MITLLKNNYLTFSFHEDVKYYISFYHEDGYKDTDLVKVLNDISTHLLVEKVNKSYEFLDKYTIPKDSIFEVRVFGTPKFNVNFEEGKLYRITYFSEFFGKELTDEVYVIDHLFVDSGEWLCMKDNNGTSMYSSVGIEGIQIPVNDIIRIETVD